MQTFQKGAGSPLCPSCQNPTTYFESRKEFICPSCRVVAASAGGGASSPPIATAPGDNRSTGTVAKQTTIPRATQIKGFIGLAVIAISIGTCLAIGGPSAEKKEYMESLQLRSIIILTDSSFKEENGIGVEVGRSGDYVYYYFPKGDFTVQTDPGEGITVNVTDGRLFD